MTPSRRSRRAAPAAAGPDTGPRPPGAASARRRVLLRALGLLAAVGLVACAGAFLHLQRHALRLAAAGLRGSRPRVVTALDPSAHPSLRAELLDELDGQVAHLERMDGGRAGWREREKALTPARRLMESLHDDRLTAAEMRSFVESSRAVRSGLHRSDGPG